ncbi:efflux RND transporter periplasmic adaptor subunit [Aquabacter sp. CN5-332]|uniref:efflux RND transporter periplasmic adaptor subunit n=1 Tax=Aquabacter sp. CN5-332 TaxID=3156608 RepID=UPI0032B4292B
MAGVLSADAAGPPMGGPPPADLVPLRDELVLERGPTLRGGSPTWTLYDPVANRFYRLGWLEFEILSRWHLRKPAEIAARISDETLIEAEPEDVERFATFLANAELLRGGTVQATQRMVGRKASMRHGWLTALLHHYLFIRIPILRPDRALGALVPILSFVYTRAFFIVTVLAGLLGLYLALRQWDTFSASFPWFFSLEGAAVAGAALLASKMLHELGHGLTAKRLGCRVPSMGVALLVLAPVLYTDTSAAWRLPERRKRLAIGLAGVAAECCLAAYALLAWSFLPEGLLRSVVFIWATTTWVLTVLINMSPFMRFDGYYLFADLIDVPNLQDRSFALTRHKLREILFDLREPPPEVWSPDMRRVLLGYAVCTWVYRFLLFMGIALLVYHMFFKILGVFLFAVEVWWFLLRPVVREMSEWVKRRRGQKMNARTLLTFSVFGLILLGLFIPWRTSVHAPALLAAQTRVRLYTEVPGQVANILVKVGTPVKEGAALIEFQSPDISYKRDQAVRQIASITAQIQAASQEPEFQSKAQLLARDLDSARAALAAAQSERERLTIRSPIAGTVVEMAEPLGQGEWMKPNELVAIVADLSSTRVDAYVDEADLDRIPLKARAEFIPTNIAAPRVPAEVTSIDGTATRALADPELASVNGGAIAARQAPGQGQNELLVPEVPVYRVTLTPTVHVTPDHTRTGTAIIEGYPASIAGQVWRKVVSVIIRESGF